MRAYHPKLPNCADQLIRGVNFSNSGISMYVNMIRTITALILALTTCFAVVYDVYINYPCMDWRCVVNIYLLYSIAVWMNLLI